MEERGWRPRWERSAEVNKVVFPASGSVAYHTVAGLQGLRTEGSGAQRSGDRERDSTETSRRTQPVDIESCTRLQEKG